MIFNVQKRQRERESKTQALENKLTNNLRCYKHSQCEVLAALLLRIQVFWKVAPCHWVRDCRNFKGLQGLCFQSSAVLAHTPLNIQALIQAHTPLNIQALIQAHTPLNIQTLIQAHTPLNIQTLIQAHTPLNIQALIQAHTPLNIQALILQHVRKCHHTITFHIPKDLSLMYVHVCVIHWWCGMVPVGVVWCRLACLSTSLENETAVPTGEIQRWNGSLGQQQSLMPLLRNEPPIVQPVALLHTNNSHLPQHHATRYCNQRTVSRTFCYNSNNVPDHTPFLL
jgi:hypothetical protein